MKKYLLSLFVISLVVIACKTADTASIPVKTENIATNISAEDLKAGEDLFTSNCGNCHKLPSPQKFTAAQWHPIVAKMKVKAKISDDQANLVEKYLVSNAKQ